MVQAFPHAADAAAAKRLIETFGAQGTGLVPLLEALGGNSPYLRERASAEPELLREIAKDGAASVLERTLAELGEAEFAQSKGEIARAVRLAKRRVALACAVGDIGGTLSLAEVTSGLSALAEAALNLTVRHLLWAEGARGNLRVNTADPARNCGFCVLAMGKLGARELNYSSDIDLIILYDPDLHEYARDEVGTIFARMARDLGSLMSAVDQNGYVFRVDLRLRPDPASTPPAIGLLAALSYYESQGHTWERAAMIKARLVAGDLAMGARFLGEIQPFIWRRYLDFAAIGDIYAMKQRIDAHKGTGIGKQGNAAQRILGHNLKLGEGGIREIEFFAQTFQLVWGGREPGVRAPATLEALHALRLAGHISEESENLLHAAYVFLRVAEHRLQMVDDFQTHSLPKSPEGLERFAIFMGEANAEDFAEKLLEHLRAVHGEFLALFDTLPKPPGIEENGAIVIPPQFTRRVDILKAMEAWKDGGPRALRTSRGRGLFDRLAPLLLQALARQPQPDIALLRFDEMLWRLPAGVQIFSMFLQHPELLDRLADVLGAAPFLADHLASTPAALDGLLSVQPAVDAGMILRERLRETVSVDEALAIAAPVIRGEEFRIALQELDGQLSVDEAGVTRSALAQNAITALVPVVMKDHWRRFGRLTGGSAVVVAMGKLGSREMLAGSDLDLMVIYDHPPDAMSAGPKSLAGSQFFSKATQSLIAALTVPTRDGPLYTVDMRLRPSGNKGPVAVSLAGFVRYHHESARTWERLALTRARVVAGPRDLARRVETAIRDAIIHAGEAATILQDTAAMRALIAKELPAKSAFDVKLREGGLMEVEFVAQALQLIHARDNGKVLQATTRDAFAELEHCGILTEGDARLLIFADQCWRAVQGLLRITLGRELPVVLPEPVAARLPSVFGEFGGEAGAMEKMELLAGRVREIFLRVVGRAE